MFEKFLKNEIEELRQNKIRLIGLGICLIFAIGFALWNYFDTGEEIILNENPATEGKKSSVQKVTSEKITKVIGANSDILFVKNPFYVEKIVEEQKIEPIKIEKKIIEPEKVEKIPEVEEKFILLGTAITTEEKSALIQHKINSATENLFLTIGDEIGGKKIIDIAEDFLILEDGEKLYLILQ